MKKVLVVGNCNFDGPLIVRLIESKFKASAIEAKTIKKAQSMINKEKFDLILVNRVGDKDKRNGLELIDWINKNSKETPIMLITNYQEKMQEAVNHGAVKGFGKSDLEKAKFTKTLSKYLK